MQRATSKTLTRTLDPVAEKPGLLKTWSQKNLGSKKHRPKRTWTLKNTNPGKYGVNVPGIKKCLNLGIYAL